MSQNLTQPEEIDRILMAMAVCDLQEGVPVPFGKQAGKTFDSSRDEPGSDAGIGSMLRRSPQGPQHPQS